MLIEKYCSGKNLEIVGFYHASVDGSTEKTPVQAIADKVASNCSTACLWSLDLPKLEKKQCAMTGFEYKEQDWKQIQADSIKIGEKVFEDMEQAIASMQYLKIHDFDDHLMDAKLSWLNEDLFEKDDPLAPSAN